MEERWLPIKGTNGNYLISDHGRVMNNRKQTLLHPSPHTKGKAYLSVSIYQCTPKRQKVHQLVASHFLDNPMNYKVINHKDGNGGNNYYTNLEYCTVSHNNFHAFAMKLKKPTMCNGERNGMSKLTDQQRIEIMNMYSSGTHKIKQLANAYGVTYDCIRDGVKGKRWNSLRKPSTKNHLTAKDISEMLQISLNAAYSLINSIPHVRIGKGCIRVSREVLEGYLREQTTKER